MAEKATKREKFSAIASILEEAEGTEELVAFVVKEIDALDRKTSGPRAKTPTQRENEELAEKIASTFAGKTVTTSDVAQAFNVTTQKVTPILKKMEKEGSVVRTDAKGKMKATFTFQPSLGSESISLSSLDKSFSQADSYQNQNILAN